MLPACHGSSEGAECVAGQQGNKTFITIPTTTLLQVLRSIPSCKLHNQRIISHCTMHRILKDLAGRSTTKCHGVRKLQVDGSTFRTNLKWETKIQDSKAFVGNILKSLRSPAVWFYNSHDNLLSTSTDIKLTNFFFFLWKHAPNRSTPCHQNPNSALSEFQNKSQQASKMFGQAYPPQKHG